MLTRRLLVGSIAALAAGARVARAQTANAHLEQLWAGLEFMDSDDQRFQLAGIRHKLKLINLWASWCSGCMVEMQSLAALAGAVGRDSLEIILVSNPDDWARDRLVAQRLKLPFRLATLSPSNSPERVRAALLDRDGAYVVPRTLVFAGPENALTAQLTGSRDWAGKAGQLKAQLG